MHLFKGILYQLLDASVGKSNVTNIDSKTFIFNYPCQSNHICTPYQLFFSPGHYKFELWGAQGGDSRAQQTTTIRPGTGGKGAYASGILKLNRFK